MENMKGRNLRFVSLHGNYLDLFTNTLPIASMYGIYLPTFTIAPFYRGEKT